MLALPSTTQVERRIPKEAFYKNLKLNASVRDAFIKHVEAIVFANSIKPSTTYLKDGLSVHEILVVRIEPKGDELPKSVIETVASANQNKFVIVNGSTDRIYVSAGTHKIEADGLSALTLCGKTLDEAWDSIIAQVAFGETDGADVLGRLDRKQAIECLRNEVAALDARARKERQVSRRNDLFAQLKKKQAELAELEKEM